MYLATPFSSTYNKSSSNHQDLSQNSIAVCVTDFLGGNKCYIQDSALSAPTLSSFDISHGMDVTATVCVPQHCVLYNLYCYNDGPNTSWLLLYDTNTTSTDAPALSIPVLCNDFHDIVFPRGCNFLNGICIKASTTQDYTNVQSPGANVVFASGTYLGLS